MKEFIFDLQMFNTCQIGTTEYASLSAAINAATAGDTITMIDNETLSSKITLSNNVTLDLGGKILTSSIDEGIIISSDVTITNGTIKCTNAGGAGYYGVEVNGGDVIFKNVTVEADGSTASKYFHALVV